MRLCRRIQQCTKTYHLALVSSSAGILVQNVTKSAHLALIVLLSFVGDYRPDHLARILDDHLSAINVTLTEETSPVDGGPREEVTSLTVKHHRDSHKM